MSKPLAVLISDIHYSLPTLEVADKALRMAIDKANELEAPLIIAGDLHDTKANMRAECVNTMVETFTHAQDLGLAVFVLRGNHDQINEKSTEHALNFLKDLVCLITTSCELGNTGLRAIPYYHDPEQLTKHLKTIKKGSTIIMHQGVQGSNSGEYIQDKSAITKQDVAGFKVVSGHYHQRQTIKLPDDGTWDYIGSPYSLNFGEANDPLKGFQILMDDGGLEFVPTNLRKHVVIDNWVSELVATPYTADPTDIVWFKLRGSKKELATVTRQLIADNYGITQDFRLDLIPNETEFDAICELRQNMSQHEHLEATVNSVSGISYERKANINKLWKGLV